MKPDQYWQSLDAREKEELVTKTGKTRQFLCNLFYGKPVSLDLAVEISSHCEGLIDPVDLVSESNRKALKTIGKAN